MWPVIIFILAILVSAGATLGASGPSLSDAQAAAQAQTIRRIALEVSQAARTQLTLAPGISLPSIGLPSTLPDPALYGPRDLFLPYSAIVAGGHDWLPTVRQGPEAAIPPLPLASSLTDARAYEVGIADCANLRTLPYTNPYFQLLNVCPSEPGTTVPAYYKGRPTHVLVIKAGWLSPGRPTTISDPNEVLTLLQREFGSVYPMNLDSWRSNGGQPIDSFLIRL